LIVSYLVSYHIIIYVDNSIPVPSA